MTAWRGLIFQLSAQKSCPTKTPNRVGEFRRQLVPHLGRVFEYKLKDGLPELLKEDLLRADQAGYLVSFLDTMFLWTTSFWALLADLDGNAGSWGNPEKPTTCLITMGMLIDEQYPHVFCRLICWQWWGRVEGMSQSHYISIPGCVS